jgi:uncharacterized protein
MQILPLYASLLAILFVVLSIRTIQLRRKLQIAVGDQDNLEMLRAMRVHSNFSEYVPIGLILIYLMETSAAYPWLIHAIGCSLLIGRLSHAYGVSQTKEKFQYRVFGMAMTFTCILTSAAYLLFAYAKEFS